VISELLSEKETDELEISELTAKAFSSLASQQQGKLGWISHQVLLK
jgi:hypothetical protein